MPRDSKAYLWDVTRAADAISEFVVDKTYNDYIGNLLLRSAIERQFEVIGEALNQLSKVDPQSCWQAAYLISARSWHFVTCSFMAMLQSTTSWYGALSTSHCQNSVQRLPFS
jgi:hypothetical protein